MGRHIKTKPRNVRRGFTLMEVLVASSIFAVVMVFVTGAVVASSNYQSKIRIINQTSEESRRLADMITRDVRSANYPIKIKARKGDNSTIPPGPPQSLLSPSTEISTDFTFKNGIALFSSTFISNNLSSNINDIVDMNNGANMLIISLKDKAKIYQTSDNGLYYKEIEYQSADHFVDTTNLSIANSDNLISKEKLDVNVRFGGYAPDDGVNAVGQPMIKFYISVGSQNEGTYNYYKTAIRSAVTSRSYNE